MFLQSRAQFFKEWEHKAVPKAENVQKNQHLAALTLILPRSRTGTVWFYTSTSSTTKTVHKVINKGLKTYV